MFPFTLARLGRTRQVGRDLKICSLLPSATEILYALGLGEQIVAVTHECDYPPGDASRNRKITES